MGRPRLPAASTTRRKSGVATSTKIKRVTDESRYFAATVGVGESNIRVGSREVNSAECLARNVQWVHVCTHKNASACTAVPLRLYMPESGSGGQKCRRVTNRKRIAYLKNPARGVGYKAAMYAEGAGDVVEVLDHPVLDLIHRPNPWMTGTQFFLNTYTSLWLTGNRYWHLVEMRGGGIEALYPMLPQWTRIIPSRETFINGYVYGRSGAIEDVFAPDEVMHAKLWENLRTPYYGGCPLHAVFGETDLDAADLANETATNANNCRPDWILEAPEGVTEANLQALQDRINANHRGPKNRGKMLIVTATNPKSLQFLPRDMEAVLSRQDRRTIIWAAYGLPESQLKVNNANVASANTGQAQYQRETIAANINVQAEVMTEQLLAHYDIEPGEMWFAYDDPCERDNVAEATMLTSFVTTGILTKDEARAELGYDPLPNGLGEAKDPADEITAEQAGRGQQGGDKGPDKGGRTEGKRHRSDPCPGGADDANVSAGARCGDDGGRNLHGGGKAIVGTRYKDKRDPVVAQSDPKKVDALKVAIEDYLLGIAGKVVIEETTGRVTLAGVEVGVVAGNVFIPSAAVPLTMVQDVAQIVRPAIGEMFVDGLTQGLVSIGQSLPKMPATAQTPAAALPETPAPAAAVTESAEVSVFGELAPGQIIPTNVLNALEQHTIKLAKEVSAETMYAIKTALAEGITNGDTTTMLTERLARGLGETAPYRSERIARTESVRAHTAGAIAGWKEAGVTHKRWVLSTDPCPLCVALSEKFNAPIPIDQAFFKVGDTLQMPDGTVHTNAYLDQHGPPGHPNCRCGLEAVEAPQ